MDTDNLIRMANQIGDFFASLPDRAEAEVSISEHIRKFWAPRMRIALLSTLDSTAGDALSPLVRAVLVRDRKSLMPIGSEATAKV
jgi:formate dehydrogenase subunit delta